MTKLKSSTHSLDRLLSTVPSEMLYEIFANLPFVELLNIFTLNREIYNLLMESEYFFEKLCRIYCKLNDITESEYGKAVESVKERKDFKNLYFSVMRELISCFGYKWDTEYQYYKVANKFELTSNTFKTIEKPSHGDFYTVKSVRLLKPGRYYKWKIKLDNYHPGIVSNSFKIMIGIESLNFFPFNDQHSGDVIGWQSESKGIALITGTKEIIHAGCGDKHKTFKVEQNFETGDIIQIEFDLTNVPNVIPLQHTTERYSDIEDDVKYMGSVRFSLIRDKTTQELRPWYPFGDVRFAPFVPAVSVNSGQTISFV
ncbi:hypothetical protein NAEGRDRAFT_62800 [Naegleria gruberi]|uniref:F-box domain-containing protein n=1 Tax=Naegleria gruberi TaxID=5762 RepID=D2V191_NAEGR|nr:uncharacterized protein NAEGRDRAFT_62800 [Naegleria gruberi]EFC49267.1 hypothetical protein NAEGRDRAFT_62800 [Naegleria gruberi]|eukprot:XP_002682011.1 hypothetical protein NAEGRDRAFT_62800 [Naegleria gruberi strain NEG-M]